MTMTFRAAILACGIASLSPVLAHAQTGVVKGDYVGCVTKDALDQMTNALVNKDKALFSSLMGKRCLPVNGQQFSVLDRGFVTSKIKVYIAGDSVDLWVPSEATR